MDTARLAILRNGLWEDVQGRMALLSERPVLAHYTTFAGAEGILRSNELWFSHPLLMNDHQEVVGGIHAGLAILNASDALRSAFKDEETYRAFLKSFQDNVSNWGATHLFNTFVFCLTQHLPDAISDGVLSMWRGYGDDGNGVALVFDPLGVTERPGSPLIIDKVEYLSAAQRDVWLTDWAGKIARFIAAEKSELEDVDLIAKHALERLKMAAIFSKHTGFQEEREWRAVYLSDRDHEGVFEPYRAFHVGPRGIEPKLKFKLEPIPDFSAPDLSMAKLLSRVIIGPNRATPLAVAATRRMLDSVGLPGVQIWASSIPYRSM